MVEPSHSTPPRVPQNRQPRLHHVWITLWGIEAVPGLLCMWRQNTAGEWAGWVISTENGIGAHDHGPYIRQTWVPATHIHAERPAPRKG